MKIVFLNPFLPTDLNEKVTSVSFKIGSFDYIAKHANVKTTEIDFDKRIIQINDALDSTASLRELVRAFFIIVAYELNLNAEFPNSEKAHLDDIAMAHSKLNEIVAKINSARDASTTGGIVISIFIRTTGTQENLTISINVI